MAKRLSDRWDITGPDGDDYVWLDIDNPNGQLEHINLGKFDQVATKLADWLAAADFGER